MHDGHVAYTNVCQKQRFTICDSALHPRSDAHYPATPRARAFSHFNLSVEAGTTCDCRQPRH